MLDLSPKLTWLFVSLVGGRRCPYCKSLVSLNEGIHLDLVSLLLIYSMLRVLGFLCAPPPPRPPWTCKEVDVLTPRYLWV